MDRWIVSQLHRTIDDARRGLDAYDATGDYYWDLGDGRVYTKGVSSIQELDQDNIPNVTANLGAARLSASERDVAGAQSRVQAALAASPMNVQAHLLQAELHAAQREGALAEKAYREAVRVAPWNVAARLSLITHLVGQRSLDAAWSEVGELNKTAPGDPRSAFAKALVQVEQGKYAEARESIQQVLKVVDRAYLLETGRIKSSGRAADLLASDDIRKAYLGI